MLESESEDYNESEENYNKKINQDKQAELNKLIEEYQIATSKKNVYINREDILREIFMTVSNRLEVDPFITDKLHFKKKKGEKGCCNLY
jgi:hypothetical protein